MERYMEARNCLIVDDEPFIRTYLQDILEPEGFQCVEAVDACEALRLIRQRKGQFDLVVTDIKMPGDMDGVDLAYSIRSTYPALPVVLISGFADRDSLGEVVKIFDLIQKPFLPAAIVNAARKALHTHRKDAASETRRPPNSSLKAGSA